MRTFALLALTVAACATEPTDDPETGDFDGTSFDADHPGANLDDGKSDAPHYTVPHDLPQLVAPEIVVSLDGLTVHLFDRETGFQAVYPAGVGVKVNGRSITPIGHFTTGPVGQPTSWWYVARRTVPEYFDGLPFLRLTATNSAGSNTYALHGPITTDGLHRGYVSHGCVRMAHDDIIDLFWMVNGHFSTPVTIQKEIELDAAGHRVDVGTTPAL